MNSYKAIVRKYPNGTWLTYIAVSGDTAREVKRELAKQLRVAQSKTEKLKLGKNLIRLDDETVQVRLDRL